MSKKSLSKTISEPGIPHVKVLKDPQFLSVDESSVDKVSDNGRSFLDSFNFSLRIRQEKRADKLNYLLF